MEEGITYKDLFFSFGEILSILDLKIIQSPNRHGEMMVKALISGEQGERLFYEMPQTVALKYLDGQGEKNLFRGALVEHNLEREEEHYILTMKLMEASYWLDISRKTRCFQNLSMTSHQVIDEVLSGYPSPVCIKSIPCNPIGQLIYQYEETDWEFLCRFLSIYSSQLYPDASGNGIQIKAGLSKETEMVNWDHHNFLVKKDLKRYRFLKQNGRDDCMITDFTSYVITCYDIVSMGSQITYRSIPWFISRLERWLEGGILKSRYQLTQENGLIVPRIYNESLSGISVNGQVTGVLRDKIQVNLLEDQLKCTDGKYWFPYSTVAASSDGSGWYCMPEKGDPVRVYFPTCKEAEAYAITNIKGGGSAGKNPNVRSIQSPGGNQIKYTKTGIIIEAGSGAGQISVGKDGTMSITSKGGVTFGAGNQICLEAPEVEAVSDTELNLINDGGSDVTITQGEVTLHGQEIYEN